MARRTAENAESAEDMLAHFQGRLDAFSRVQAALTRNADACVDLKSLIEDELVAHAARDGEQVQIKGPEVLLDARCAERLNLAIHELTTNAVKHGALVSEQGRIEVAWETEEAEGGKQLKLRWTERGVTIDPSRDKREGFGMELLLRSLPYDLQCDTKVELTPTGLHFELRMPLTAGGA
jgi:two-component system CheB/CheR fusion protein